MKSWHLLVALALLLLLTLWVGRKKDIPPPPPNPVSREIRAAACMKLCLTEIALTANLDEKCPLCVDAGGSVEEYTHCLRFSGCYAGMMLACSDRCGGR